MKTIGQIIHHSYTDLIIYDNVGHVIFYEDAKDYWAKWKFNSDGEIIYFENSMGDVVDYENNC